MNDKIMNILLSCDDRIAKYIPALQESLYENHDGIFVRIFIIHTKIPSDVMGVIKNFAVKKGHEVIEIVPNNEDFELFKSVDPTHLDLFPIEAYYHFGAHKYLPDSIDRVLYLDVDTICVGSFYDWYNTEFHSAFFISSEKTKKDNYFMFNSGVFLINLRKMREENIFPRFYLKALDDFKHEKGMHLHGDQDFIGYSFRNNPDNGFFAQVDRGINFRIVWFLNVALDLEPLPELKIIHYIGIKGWHYCFDDSFLNKCISDGLNWGSYNYSFISTNVLAILNEFWKYAKKAPYYSEIYQQAVVATQELKQKSMDLLVLHFKQRALLAALSYSVALSNSMDLMNFVPLKIPFGQNCIKITQSETYIEYKTNFFVKEQWLAIPLCQALKQGNVLTLKIKCEYKTKNKIWLFLSDNDLNTLHLPAIASNEYIAAITADKSRYQFLCLSSNSFPEKGDFIRFFEISAWINRN